MKINKIKVAIMFSLSSISHAEVNVLAPNVSVVSKPIIEDIAIDQYSSTSAVITDEQLRDQNAVDLGSALRRTPGVEISRYNPVGAFGGDQGGAVFIRGMGVSRPGSEIKTYIDGIPFYMGTWGHPLLDLLPINGMRSIAVYKSPQPQINGNNFASINLETKNVIENGIHGDTRMSAGSFGTFIEQTNLAGKQDALDFVFAQGYAKSNGHRRDADGELNNALGRIGYQLNENWKANLGFVYVNNSVSDPGDSRIARPAVTPKYKTEATMLTANLEHEYENLKGDIKIYQNSGKGYLHDPSNSNGWGTFTSNFDMTGFRWKEALSPWKGGKFTAGLDIDNSSGDVNGNHTGGSMGVGGKNHLPNFTVTSPFIGYSHLIPVSSEWSVLPSAGIRYYDSNKFGSETAPHAGISLISEKLTVFANVSRGINFPGAETAGIQAALPFLFASTATSKNLSAEKMDHKEIGVKWTPNNSTQINASLFSDHIKNRYLWDLGFGTGSFINMSGYHNNGAELSVKQKITDNWEAFGGLTLLNPSIKNLPYNPHTAFTAGLNGNIGLVKLALDAQYQSDVYALNRNRNQTPNTDKVDSYTVVNLRASYPVQSLGKKGEVFLAVENLFDQNYEYRPGYQMPGISGQVGFSASF
jgi:outer membrane cobalamin receptor